MTCILWRPMPPGTSKTLLNIFIDIFFLVDKRLAVNCTASFHNFPLLFFFFGCLSTYTCLNLSLCRAIQNINFDFYLIINSLYIFAYVS